MQAIQAVWSSLAVLLAACAPTPRVPPAANMAQRDAPAALDAYDVVWTAPSRDASGSMPIGNGELGANVWVDGEAGELCLLLARTDSFSEASRLLKLGIVRVRLRPNPFAKGQAFEQRLQLATGTIRVRAGDVAHRVELALCVDSEADVVHVTGSSHEGAAVEVVGESWRRSDKVLKGDELASSWTMQAAPAGIEVREAADRLVSVTLEGSESAAVGAGFYHRNETSVVPLTLAHQGLEAAAAVAVDPLRHRMFGFLMRAEGLGTSGAQSEPVFAAAGVRRFLLQIAAPCLQDERPEAWRDAALALLRAADASAAFARTAAWWDAFWARSWIFVHGDRPAARPVPRNQHPLRIGADGNGQNRFVGRIESVRIERGASPGSDAEVLWQTKSPALPVEDRSMQDIDLAAGFRITATLTQEPAHPIGRIVDKVTAGRADGFLFDTHPGHALRLIVGDQQLVAEGALPGGERHEVAASYDALRGELALYRDGRLLRSSLEVAASDPEPPSRLTRALLLQRWVQACGGRGNFPIKFNGSIFTVEPKLSGGPPFDADWRRWGDCFWWQNTRLPYYPMLAQGDFEMLDPLFRLYERVLPLGRERARIYHGVEGAYFPETMTPFGTYANRDYGWDRTGRQPNEVQCLWWRYAWNQGLELVALMLDRNDYWPDAGFRRDRLLPMAEAVLRCFDTRFPRGDDGKLRLTPTQALETYWRGVENDMPCVAGLHDVLPRLLALPADEVGAERRQRWQRLQALLPPVPVRDDAGVRRLAPAGRYEDRRSNLETPELYAVFPFRLYGLGRPDLELARQTYARRHERRTEGWTQDGQFAALLGLVDEAAANVLAKVANANPKHRFPVMWGPNFDWLPDQDHGSNLLCVTQLMLLQPVGRKLLVLPSWPLAWDVDCRLHAPQGTVVEVEYRGGKLLRLVVTPPERRADVRLPSELAAAAQALGLKTFAR